MSEAKVIAINKYVHLGETDPDVLKAIEDLLEQAKKGEVRGIILGWMNGHDEISVRIAQGSAPAVHLVGCASRLAWVTNRWWDEAATEVEP